MKSYLKKIGIYALLFAFTGLILISGCKPKNDYTKPTIPPESAFAIDFSAMDSNQVKSMAEKEGAGNFLHAGVQVWIWSFLINATLAIPVAAYKVAISQVPENIDDDVWLWSFTVGVENNQYTAELTGKSVDEGANVEWNMDLSYDAPLIGFENFAWYTGTMNAEITEGQWILHEGPFKDWKFIQIDWTRSLTADVWDIKYTNIKDGDGGIGDYINHGFTADTDFNAFFNIYDKSEDNLVQIQWNRTYNNGRVKNPKYFGNEEWHCWGQDYLDCECEVTLK
jgi:hypothetical protein